MARTGRGLRRYAHVGYRVPPALRSGSATMSGTVRYARASRTEYMAVVAVEGIIPAMPRKLAALM